MVPVVEEPILVVAIVEDHVPTVEMVVEEAPAAVDKVSPTDTDTTTHVSTKPSACRRTY